MRALSLLFLCLLTAASVLGQPAGDTVERWREGQLRAAQRVSYVTCVEESDRRVEGPHGTREITTRAHLRAIPVGGRVERSTEYVEVNGRAVPVREQQRMTPDMRHGRPGRDREWDFLLSPTLFSRDLRRQSALRPDPQAGGTLRVDFVGVPDQPIEQMTLWFTRHGDRLVRSRMMTRYRPDDPPLVVETHYRRQGSLDLPDSRHIEGSVIMRRRSRTYTMPYQQQIAYRDYYVQR